MMASQPPLTPTPSCRGVSVEMAEWRAALARHFEVSRRRTSPTAMGRCPPLFFREARSCFACAIDRGFVAADGRGLVARS